MTEQVKGLAADPSDLSLSLRIHMREREPAPASCPPTTHTRGGLSTPTTWDREECTAGCSDGWMCWLSKRHFHYFSLIRSNKGYNTLSNWKLSDDLKGCLTHTTSLVKKQLSTLKVCKHSRMYIWFGNTIMLKKIYGIINAKFRARVCKELSSRL